MFSWAFKTLKIIISRSLSQTTTHLRTFFMANVTLGGLKGQRAHKPS